MRTKVILNLANTATLVVLCGLLMNPTLSFAQSDPSSSYTSRAVANGEYMLLQQTQLNAASDVGAAKDGAAGGASMADFSQLMNLIQTTVDPDSWENGDATMQAYPGGIYLDADGVVRRCKVNPLLSASIAESAFARNERPTTNSKNLAIGWNTISQRRFVSVNRLLKAVRHYADRGQKWDQELATLAGLHRIDYIVLDKEANDVYLAGPAGGLIESHNGTWVLGATKTSPILLQDVLAICNSFAGQESPTVLCSLDPTSEGLARVHALLNKPDAAARLVRNQTRGAAELAETLGGHRVSISGLDPSSPTALALLEADIHMKRLGLGLESLTGSLNSYPEWAEKLGIQPSGQLLRWWFTPDYPEISCNAEQTLFALPTRRVRLESEREKMDATGNRAIEAQGDEAADRFAKQFTEQYSAIEQKFPLYSRLSHIFDLAVSCKLAIEHSDWKPYGHVPTAASADVPREVESTTAAGTWKKGGQAHRWIVVSGGVELDVKKLKITDKLNSQNGYLEASTVGNSRPVRDEVNYWWWDESTTGRK